MGDEEFAEEDVCYDAVPQQREAPAFHSSFASSSPRRHHDPARMKPRKPEAAHESVHRPSLPMNIPNWSKIYRTNEAMKSTVAADKDEDEEDDDDDDDDDDDKDLDTMPPHEWLANKFAKKQISSSSMREGIGRTLKGRDLSTVRNAVLTKTGFLE